MSESGQFVMDLQVMEFLRRLTELSRETGVYVFGEGDWPEIGKLDDGERDGVYVLKYWGQIQWIPTLAKPS